MNVKHMKAEAEKLGRHIFNISESQPLNYNVGIMGREDEAPTIEVCFVGITFINDEYQVWERVPKKEKEYVWKYKGVGKFKDLHSALCKMYTKIIENRIYQYEKPLSW